MPDDEMEDMRKRLASQERITSQLHEILGAHQKIISHLLKSVEDLKAEHSNEHNTLPVASNNHKDSSLQTPAPTNPPPESLSRAAFINKICACNLSGHNCALEACAKEHHCYTLDCGGCHLTHGQVSFSDLTCGHHLRDRRQHAEKYGAGPETACKRAHDLSDLRRQIQDDHDRDCPRVHSRKKMGLPSRKELRKAWIQRHIG